MRGECRSGCGEAEIQSYYFPCDLLGSLQQAATETQLLLVSMSQSLLLDSSLPNLLVPAGFQQLAQISWIVIFRKFGMFCLVPFAVLLHYCTDCFKIYMPWYWGSLILLFSNILSVLNLKYISLINLWCIICILANDRSICKTSLCERLEALSYKCCLCNGIKYHHPSFPYGTTRANCCLSGGIGSCDMSNMVKLVSCLQQKKIALLKTAVPGPALPGMLSILFHHFCSMPCRFYSKPSVTQFTLDGVVHSSSRSLALIWKFFGTFVL